MERKELGIYVHIPFCKKKCYYCDFISYVCKDENIEKYINEILKQIKMYDFEECNVTTIYIGGGTPSYIHSNYIKNIMVALREKLQSNKTEFEDIEITIEVNPGTINKDKLIDYKISGINRLSIGLQSTNDDLLKQIGRIHTFKQFEETYNLAKESGFNNCNVDLMIGLPNQTIEDLKQSIEKIINLNPDHISVYSLILEENTKLFDMVENGDVKLIDEETERQMYWYVKNKLELYGYNHYEISNFAKKGKESKHNMNCWTQKEYIGIGLATHSYVNGIRFSNKNELNFYMDNNKEINIRNLNMNDLKYNKKLINIEEIQDNESMEKEYMLLGLRKIKGVSIREFKEKFLENPIFKYRKELGKLVNEELIQIDGDFIRLTNKGLDLANLVWEEFV